MKIDEVLQTLATRYGIEPSYWSFSGEQLFTSPDTQRAILSGAGIALDNDAMIREALTDMLAQDQKRDYPQEYIVCSQSAAVLPFGAGSRWQVIESEDQSIAAEGVAGDQINLPALKSGVYTLVLQNGEQSDNITLIAAPGHAPLIEDIASASRLWGVNAALYGINSARNAGIGDYEDLAQLGEILAEKGAGFVGINPVHAIGVMGEGIISPYSPSHRAMLNTRHIAIDRLSGVDAVALAEQRALHSSAGDQLKQSDHLLDYESHAKLLRSALESAFRQFSGKQTALETAVSGERSALEQQSIADFALFEAISEQHGEDWRHWPAALRDKQTHALREFRESRAERIHYHQWLQCLADGQLKDAAARCKAAGMPLGLYLDLAVGSRRGGAESWCNQAVHASGLSIGAPPDYFNPDGQNWQLAAMAPDKLKSQQYGAFRQVLRSTLRHAGVLRIDHVLGLNRSFWIPDDGVPGCYINQPCDALTAIVKIEAERAGTVIIGEDLGLVPDGFRERMRSNGFYGYSVLQFEKEDNGDLRNPAYYDSRILACFGTHDTTTLRGFEAGRDIDWSLQLDWLTPEQETQAREARAHEVNTLKHNLSGSGDVILQQVVHSSLAYSPAALVSVQLDDVLENVDAQNLPGTIEQHPNWRRQYAVPLPELVSHNTLCDVAAVMAEGGRATNLSVNDTD